jgi:hypothetical protein
LQISRTGDHLDVMLQLPNVHFLRAANLLSQLQRRARQTQLLPAEGGNVAVGAIRRNDVVGAILKHPKILLGIPASPLGQQDLVERFVGKIQDDNAAHLLPIEAAGVELTG